MIEATDLPVNKSCSALEVSRQAFYNWKKSCPSPNNDAEILKQIQQIAEEFPRYGYRRVTKELARRGSQNNHKRVHRIMRQNNLLVRRKKYKPATTQSNHDLPLYPNVAKTLAVTRLNQLWVSDITYISLLDEFIYLAAILDIFSRKCIGWDLGRSINTTLALNALTMAINDRKSLGFNGLIHHSDKGVQYASKDYTGILKKEGIIISMNETGNPRENAFAESFMKTLKSEEVHINEYRYFEEAYINIRHFIEIVYNQKRLHSGIGYLPPIEFEQEVLNRIVA